MEEVVLLCVVLVIILYYACYALRIKVNSVYIKSNVDSRYYKVRNNKNSQYSADTLATINNKIDKLLVALKKERRNINTELLLARYNPSSLQENILMENTTFTTNKGSSVSVCLSTRDTEEKIYDINLLMFVIIHEMAHIGSRSVGHTDEFIRFFKYLLSIASRENIWVHEDYYKNPKEYCGINVNHTPI